LHTNEPAVRSRPEWADDGDPFLALPKISLHDHLDGSLLLSTLYELSDEIGQVLPHSDPETLQLWFAGKYPEPKIAHWDEKFGITTRVMQTPENLARVAREFVLELAADGVVYGETRWAPEKHTAGGMSLDEAVEAVAAGLTEGERLAAAAGKQIQVRQLLCAMRGSTLSYTIAELTLRHYGPSVVGFDVAGHELGYPAIDHVDACDLLRRATIPITFHTGEHDGVASVRQTVQECHPQRLGHGTRIVEDISLDGTPLDVRTAVKTIAAAREAGTATLELGPVATWVRDRRIPLEQCLTSNSKGNIVTGIENHPLGLLKELGFAVTVNPDNRMMSGTSITREMRRAVELFGWDTTDLLDVTTTALEATFLPLPERERLRTEVVLPGYKD
jgi:adenosine deaminase